MILYVKITKIRGGVFMNNKEYFNKVAHEWDNMRKGFFSERVREKALNVAGVQSEKIAADIGAGTGFITEALIQRGLKVIAVDQSDAMLEEMKKKFINYDVIDYRLGEAENLPIENETVDYVFANMYLHHVESPHIAIKEMVRILKKGGKLIITDLDEHNFEFLKTEQYDRWMGFKRSDIKKWLIESGLKNVVVECLGEDCCAQSNCGDDYANITIFVATGVK